MKSSGLKVATVVGVIGSGKSTAMPLVAKALKAHPVEADNFFQTTNPFRDDYLASLPRWSLANETWLTLERAEMIGREKERAEKLKKAWMVVDSGLVMSWAYMRMHLMYNEVDEKEWRLFCRVFEEVAVGKESEVVLWLDVRAETALERVKRRGRDYELEFYTLEYLANLRQAVTEVAEKLKKDGVKVVKFDEEMVGNIVSDRGAQKEFEEWVRRGVAV